MNLSSKMDLEESTNLFSYENVRRRAYRENRRKLRPVRAIVHYFELSPHDPRWIVLYVGSVKNYDDALHFWFQTTRLFEPQLEVNSVFDGEVNESWDSSPEYMPRLANPSDIASSLSEHAFWSLVESKRVDFPPRLEILDSAGRFVQGWTSFDNGLEIEVIVQFENFYCKLSYRYPT